MILFLSQLISIMPLARSGAVYLPAINAAMAEFKIDGVYPVAGWLANLAHESGEFRYMEELADGSAYDDRDDLGNTKPHAIEVAARHGTTPGRFWKGHGPIQITGYDNHLNCGNALGLDLIENPLLLTQPRIGCRGAAWFWSSHGCNERAATGDEAGFRRATRKVNPALLHYDRRLAYWVRCVRVLKNTPRDYALEPITSRQPYEQG